MALLLKSSIRNHSINVFPRALSARIGSTAPQMAANRLLSVSNQESEFSFTETSVRAKFKSTPVNPSILQYIKKVGVGKPKRKKRRKKQKGPRPQFLSPEEEREQLQRVRRPPSKDPPPPFPSAKYKGSNSNIQCYPVKLLGRVGSIEDEFPRESAGLPEVAIAGRSNVGKSTLLNALLYGERKSEEEEPKRHRHKKPTSRTAKLPRGMKAVTSSKPGETRSLSFYQLSARVDENKVSLLLVDLPGYGFAFAKEEKLMEWQSLMESYILNQRKSLKRILFLVDSRHGMKKADIEFLETLQESMYDKAKSRKKAALPPIQLVLTKCDLVSQTDLAKRVIAVRKQLSDCLVRETGALPVMLVSAQIEGQGGVIELQKELASIVGM